MERYLIRDGLVSDMASDFAGAQEAIESNLTKRLRMAFGHGGIKFDADSTCDFTWVNTGLGLYKITILSIRSVLFGDYSIFSPEDAVNRSTSINPYIPDETILYIYLHKVYDYADEGEYEPGYPDGVSVEQGKNTNRYVDIEVSYSTNFIKDSDYLCLYRVQRDGDDLVVLDDYRNDASLDTVSADVLEPPEAVSGVVVSTYNQSDLAALDDEIDDMCPLFSRNNLSPITNTLINAVFASISWDSIVTPRIWAYDVKLVPYQRGSLWEAGAIRRLVLADPAAAPQRLWIELPEGVKFDVSIRAIDDSLKRQAGPWSSPVVFYANSSAVTAAPSPPQIFTSYPVPYLPVVEIKASSDEQNTDSFIQVMWQPANGPQELAYEGPSGVFQYLVPYDTPGSFTARTVKRGVCSNPVMSALISIPKAPIYSKPVATIPIPIHIPSSVGNLNDQVVNKFIIPFDCSIESLAFFSFSSNNGVKEGDATLTFSLTFQEATLDWDLEGFLKQLTGGSIPEFSYHQKAECRDIPEDPWQNMSEDNVVFLRISTTGLVDGYISGTLYVVMRKK